MAEMETQNVSLWDGTMLGWVAVFHGSYWLCRATAGKLFKTYSTMGEEKQGYWCSSMVSSFHASLITALSARALWNDARLRHGTEFFYSTPESLQAARIFYAYICSDLVLTLYYRSRWSGWLENLVHHITILATWSVFINTKSGQYFACIAQICELTTPFVNQRWFLHEAGLKSSQTYVVNGLLMLVLWFVTRVGLYSFCGYKMYLTLPQLRTLGLGPTVTVVFSYLAGLTLQYFWFYKILRGGLKGLRAKKKAEDMNDSKKKQ